MNKEAPLVRKFVRNVYRRVSDKLGVERYQSVPLLSLIHISSGDGPHSFRCGGEAGTKYSGCH